MSGETEANVSAWTVDSVLTHILTVIEQKDDRIAERDRCYAQRFVAQETATEVALENVRTFYDALLAERDRRYAQRVDAMEASHDTSVKTIIKEFTDRIDQVRSETVLAMAAAEKAISKAEAATERRFESVNEFRAQQADIIQTFARKTEVDTRLIGLTEKVDGARAQAIEIGATAMPRNEYDRAHTDLAERVIGVEKTLTEKLEAQVKTLDARIALLQSQISSIEAVTR